MSKKENPAFNGASKKPDDITVTEPESSVKSLVNENLIFFHTAFQDLNPEDYKSAMSAIVSYVTGGTIPNLSGSLKVIFTLAKDRIDGTPKQSRRRGAPAGNKNACKKQTSEPEKQIKTIHR